MKNQKRSTVNTLLSFLEGKVSAAAWINKGVYVGEAEGAWVGVFVGIEVGAGEGTTVGGWVVGFKVGCEVGLYRYLVCQSQRLSYYLQVHLGYLLFDHWEPWYCQYPLVHYCLIPSILIDHFLR